MCVHDLATTSSEIIEVNDSTDTMYFFFTFYFWKTWLANVTLQSFKVESSRSNWTSSLILSLKKEMFRNLLRPKIVGLIANPHFRNSPLQFHSIENAQSSLLWIDGKHVCTVTSRRFINSLFVAREKKVNWDCAYLVLLCTSSQHLRLILLHSQWK